MDFSMSTDDLFQLRIKSSKSISFVNLVDSTDAFPASDAEAAHRLVLMRCGDPTPSENFAGWANYELSEEGRKAMREAAMLLKKENYKFDHAYCSILSRCEESVAIILEELDLQDIPVTKDWRLNSRHLGAITGMSKIELAAKYGVDQVDFWLDCSEYLMPPMDEYHPLYNSIYNHESYAGYSDLPLSESGQMTYERVVKYWTEEISPRILMGEKILIVSHNKALQGLIQHLDDVDYTFLEKSVIPKAMPFYYQFDEALKPISTKHNLSE